MIKQQLPVPKYQVQRMKINNYRNYIKYYFLLHFESPYLAMALLQAGWGGGANLRLAHLKCGVGARNFFKKKHLYVLYSQQKQVLLKTCLVNAFCFYFAFTDSIGQIQWKVGNQLNK